MIDCPVRLFDEVGQDVTGLHDLTHHTNGKSAAPDGRITNLYIGEFIIDQFRVLPNAIGDHGFYRRSFLFPFKNPL